MARTLAVFSMIATLAAAQFGVAGCSANRSIVAPTEAEAARERAEQAETEVAVTVSPGTLVLESPGTWVTVHAEIPLSLVDCSTLELEGIEAAAYGADARGYLVVKFTRTSIAGIVAPPEATLTLRGTTVAGDPFSGSDTIAVVDRLND